MNKSTILALIIIVSALVIGTVPGNPLFQVNWLLLSTIIVIAALLAFFSRFERGKVTSGDVALIAAMASLAAVARLPFAALMSVQPTAFMAMITGYVFGARAGFLVGAIAVLVSNFFVGQGPWTPWQMFCMGISGASASLLAARQSRFNIKTLALFCGFWGYLYGWIMNIWHWTGFVYPLNWNTFLAIYMASLWFDTFRAAGNVMFTVLLGNSFYHILVRFRKKLIVQHIDIKHNTVL